MNLSLARFLTNFQTSEVKLARATLAQTEGLEEVFAQKKTKGAKNWA
jgi:hypothetical protein